MPFEKGRKKTGGRTKGGPKKKPTKLIDQLKDAGFNYVKELAKSLKDLPPAKKYDELRSLLPFMAPKLKEKEVDISEAPDEEASRPEKITDAELLEALSEPESRKEDKGSSPDPVAAGNSELQVPNPASPTDDLQNVDAEQTEE